LALTEEEAEIVRRILKYEEEHKGDYWEWWQVGVHPAKLMRLVNKGVVIVVGKGKNLRYRLNREALAGVAR